jgi:Xaa-Pro aminopeptidase
MDEAFPFRQDSNFWYLTGLNEPDLILVKTSTEEFLLIPDIYAHRQSIMSVTDKDQFIRSSGVDQILDHREGWKKLKEIIKTTNLLATTMPSPQLLNHYGIYTNPAKRLLLNKIKRINPKLSFEDLRPLLATLRMAKQDLEVGFIKKAIDITLDTLSQVLNKPNLVKYDDTAQIERDILAGFIKRGGGGHGFSPIVASGADAAIFHFEKLGVPLRINELLYCDVGSTYGAYAADITRTVAFGQPTKRASEVFIAVKTAQAEARSLIRPGIMLKDYELEVDQIVGRQLINLGLIKDLKHKSIKKYYPHLCSHSLGLDIHDATNWDTPVPLNMVMTVEPGIYIPEEGIGVRIEDVVLVTSDGTQLLSSSLGSSL